MSFTTRPGETTAIIGSTGSGKTTLINLIPRIYDATGGQVLINGIDVRDLSQEELRSHLGVVPQKALLFDGTIASNLQYGKEDATEEEMWHALEVAQGKDFVSQMPQGWRPPFLRAAPTYPAVSASVWPLPGLSSASPMCIFSTTASLHWTSRPMQSFVRP